MKEKELRLALVCYGGVSLAIYMHGMTKEVLKLARASKALHAHNKRAATYSQSPDASPYPSDSEDVYYDLLRQISADLDLRVVTDIIAGASAGGINACILGRALAHDLDIEPVREFWLKEGGVERLMPEHVKANWRNKILLYPAIWLLKKTKLGRLPQEPEFQKNLSMFLRSRWFDAPFDGPNLTRVLYGGMEAMGEPPKPGASLVPVGLKLDLFVTVTNFHGYRIDTVIHDPPVVAEREHRQVLTFSYRQWPRGTETTSFDTPNLPGLAWAARATSSFPGAFPPAHLGEAQDLVHQHGLQWPNRVDFLYENFAPYVSNNMNPSDAVYIDGSVLNNRPFAEAIAAIDGRPAYRQVDRRVIYIEPNPTRSGKARKQGIPGFFSTIKGALSDIPRHQPISDELERINAFNEQVRRLRATLEATRPHIRALVADIDDGTLDGTPDAAAIGALRNTANLESARRAGFAYEGYLRLKLDAVLDEVGAMFAHLSGCRPESIQGQRLNKLVHAWALLNGVSPREGRLAREMPDGANPAWVDFLLHYDRRFRVRRVRFVIRAVNELYQRIGEEGFEDLTSDDLDDLKAALYDGLAAMPVVTTTSLSNSDRARLAQVDNAATVQASERHAGKNPDIASGLTPVMESLKAHLNLNGHNAMMDELMAEHACKPLPRAAWRLVLEAYLGFSVWDVLTFNLTNWRQLGEFDEIRVDRMSSEEARSLTFGSAERRLKGLTFNHFGAFFSRAFRAHDYLWGRLHAADRLIDIVLDAAAIEGAGRSVDAKALKRDVFLKILDQEASLLPECAELIAELKAEAAAL